MHGYKLYNSNELLHARLYINSVQEMGAVALGVLCPTCNASVLLTGVQLSGVLHQ